MTINKITFGQLLMQMHAAAMKDPAIVNLPVAFKMSDVKGYYLVDRVDIVESLTHYGDFIMQLQPVAYASLIDGIDYYNEGVPGEFDNGN